MNSCRYSRQSFLGDKAEEKIEQAIIGIIGLGGGGSHIVQQLAHIGFKNYVIYDGQEFEESNINRLIGSKFKDIGLTTPKIKIAQRMIYGLQPKAKIDPQKKRWQENPCPLRKCDIIFGCVDGYAERRELEIMARRYMIPYIDIGVDVHDIPNQPPFMSGQVILSMPGGPCLTCMGFLNEKSLAKEFALYGSAGPRPQVVWANGVLASTAVGIAVDLICGWTKTLGNAVYLSYDGNLGIVSPNQRIQYVNKNCCHFPSENVGDPIFKAI